MATLEVEHTFNCSEATFWDRIFLDPEYNERLFKTELKFPVWREVSREERGGVLYRTLEVVPYVGELPTALKAVVGEGVGYEERGQLDRGARRYKVDVVPNRLADKVSVKVEMSTTPVRFWSVRFHSVVKSGNRSSSTSKNFTMRPMMKSVSCQ